MSAGTWGLRRESCAILQVSSWNNIPKKSLRFDNIKGENILVLKESKYFRVNERTDFQLNQPTRCNKFSSLLFVI
jgi:hypothetical protein